MFVFSYYDSDNNALFTIRKDGTNLRKMTNKELYTKVDNKIRDYKYNA